MAIDELTILQWVLAGGSALLVGLSKAGFGTGAGILAVPLMATILDPADMLPVMLLVLISGDVLTLPHYVRSRDRRSLAMLVPGMLAGIVLGALALDWFLALPGSRLWMRRMIGGVSVAFVLLQLYRMARENQLGSPIRPYRPRAWHGVSIGLCAGATSTLAHAGGPLVALFLLPQKLDRRVFVGTLVRFFFAANVVKLVPYARQGLITPPRCLLALLLLPCVVGGSLVGAWMNRRFSDRAFRLAVYALAFAVGVHLLLSPGAGRRGRRRKEREPAGQTALFAAGLRACARADYAAAVDEFGAAAAEQGPVRQHALFNLAVSLYEVGRYGEAEGHFNRLRGTVGVVLGLRVDYNLGNCAYRSGRHAPAARWYDSTAERCRLSLDGHGRARPNAQTVREVLRRAEHNLALVRRSLAKAEAAVVSGARETVRPSRADPGAGAADAAQAQIPLPGRQELGAGPTGLPSDGAAGLPTVQEVLAGPVSRDTGPVVPTQPVQSSVGSPNW